MPLNDWIIAVCEELSKLGFTAEELRTPFAQYWQRGLAPKTAALLAIKEGRTQ